MKGVQQVLRLQSTKTKNGTWEYVRQGSSKVETYIILKQKATGCTGRRYGSRKQYQSMAGCEVVDGHLGCVARWQVG